jgi:symplekin
MHRTRIEAFDEINRKRPAPSEPTDGLDPSKRQRVAATIAVQQPPPVPELPPGPVSWAQLYTLNAEGSMNFDVQAFQDPGQLVRIVVPVLQSVDEEKLKQAIQVRRLILLPSLASRVRPLHHIISNPTYSMHHRD